MLREDGTSYLNVLKVQTSIEIGDQPITATPSTIGTNVSIDPTGMTNVTAENVQSAIAQLDNLVGGGGSYTEPTILGTHHKISGNFAPANDAVISNNIAVPSGGAGTYEIEAKVQYLLTGGTSNQVISLVKNGTVLTGDLASDTFNGEGNGVQSHFVKYYLNSLIVGDIIGINFNSSVTGTGNNSLCQLTLKKLQNTVTITPTNDSAAGGA